MVEKRIFISFYADEDKHYKNLLLAWDKNKIFDFSFYDDSLKDAINSSNADYIKSKIKPLITGATHLLCIIGEKTHKSDWVEWEINTAIANKKKLIGVKISKDFISPDSILYQGAMWALSFNFEAIKKAIEDS